MASIELYFEQYNSIDTERIFLSGWDGGIQRMIGLSYVKFDRNFGLV